MEAEQAHHVLVRLSSNETSVRVVADSAAALDERQLQVGPMGAGYVGEWWLWEELLVAAAGTSLLDCFRALARHERLPVGALSCTAEAIFHEGRGRPLSRLVLRVTVETTPDDIERAEAIIRRARDECVAAGALAVPLDVQVTAVASGSSLAAP